MPTLLVSGAGLGDSSVHGTTGVANASPGALPPGWLDEGIGALRISPDALGRNVAFNFTVALTQSADNVRLDFDTARPVPPRGWLDERFGTASVVNVAQGAQPPGWLDERVGPGTFVSADLAGRKVDFNFTLSFFQLASNVGLYFGGGPLVAGVTVGLQTRFGTATVTNAATALYPIGIPPLDPFHSVFAVGRGGSINFNFVDAYAPPSGAVVRLDFDPQRPIPVRGLNATLFGTTTVANKAFGIFPPSIPPSGFGQPLISGRYMARNVVFEFNDLYTPVTGINVAFAFGDSKSVHNFGWDSQIFGTLFITTPGHAHPPGWDSLAFGVPRVKFNAIQVPGIDSLRFGTHRITYFQRITVTGFDAHAFGTPQVAYHAILPIGFYDTVFGPATDVNFRRRYTRPLPILGTGYGLHFVALRNRVLEAFGRNQLEMGVPTIYNAEQTLQPLGFSDEAFGEPTLRLNRQFINAYPDFDSMVFGFSRPNEPDEDDRGLLVANEIGPTQIIAPLTFNQDFVNYPSVGYFLQYVILLDTKEMTQWGLPSVYDRIRRIFVPWSSFTQWGRPIFGFVPKIEPYPILPGDVGVPDVTLGNIRKMQGWQSSVVSKPSVRSSHMLIVVAPWDEKEAVSRHLVYNLRQYIFVDNKQYFDYVPYFSDFNDVRNRNRVIEPAGIVPLHVPNTHRAILLGQQTLPTAGDQTLWGDHMVAFRVRHLSPSWRFAGFVDPYHYVHNQATRIYPVGIDSLKITLLHKAWFNAQTIAPRFIAQEGYGKPFVSFSPRYLVQFNSELGSAYGIPWVSLGTRTVVQKPFATPYAFGTPSLKTYKIIIGPFPISFNLYGRPTVRNVTPQLYPSMEPQDRYGTPWVSHAPRDLKPDVVITTTVGYPIVLFRDRYLYPPGMHQLEIPMPTVRQEYEEQIFNQTLLPYGFDSAEIGSPLLPVHPHPFGWDSLEFGLGGNVRLQGCKPYWPYPDSMFKFGFPTLVYYQTVTEVNRDDEFGSQLEMGKPAVSPFTIWARTDTPAQAIRNHPGYPYHIVDSQHNQPPPWFNDLPPWIGIATVTTPGDGRILHHHRGDTNGVDFTRGDLIGEPMVENAIRYIFPKGPNTARYGLPILNHPEHLWVVPFLPTGIGEHKVGFVKLDYTQYAAPEGIGPDSVVEKPEVQNWIRNVYPDGFDATIYGNNDPMVYHYPRGPKQAGGTDMQAFGPDTWISFWIREFQMDGWDSFTEGYTFGSFEDRMRVIQEAGHPVISAGDTLRMGIPDVALGKRAPQTIGPYMIPPPQYCHPHSIEAVS